jgi:hypothetical protein
MKLEEARDAYYESTDKTSELARTLSFSGIAVAWVIRIGEAGSIGYNPILNWVFIAYVLALTVDLLQYVTKALTWGIFNHLMHRRGVKLDDEVDPPRWFNNAPIFFWVFKLLLAASGSILLLVHLFAEVLKPDSASA